MVEKRSFDLKLDRAEQHLVDFDQQVASYVKGNPYTVTKGLEGKGKRERWVHRLRIEPISNPWLPIIAGDVLHNMRSALDHVAVASVPRNRRYDAFFPINEENIWEIDIHGNLLKKHDASRKAWYTATQGMSKAARAIVKDVQPYNRPDPLNIGRKHHALVLLSSLENADKHRELSVLVSGVKPTRVTGILPDGSTEPIGFEMIPNHILDNDAEIPLHETGLDPAAVNVKVEGTVQVLIGRTGSLKTRGPFYFGLLDEMLRFIRDEVVTPLGNLI